MNQDKIYKLFDRSRLMVLATIMALAVSLTAATTQTSAASYAGATYPNTRCTDHKGDMQASVVSVQARKIFHRDVVISFCTRQVSKNYRAVTHIKASTNTSLLNGYIRVQYYGSPYYGVDYENIHLNGGWTKVDSSLVKVKKGNTSIAIVYILSGAGVTQAAKVPAKAAIR